jgi:hypothetical protein
VLRRFVRISIDRLTYRSGSLEERGAFPEVGLASQIDGLRGRLPGLLQPTLGSEYQRLKMLGVARRLTGG